MPTRLRASARVSCESRDASVVASQIALAEIPSPLVDETVPAPILCPVCGTARQGDSTSCDDCGYYFSSADLARSAASQPAAATAVNNPTRRTNERT